MPARRQMERSLVHLQGELANIRTGRATPGMLDHLKVGCWRLKLNLGAEQGFPGCCGTWHGVAAGRAEHQPSAKHRTSAAPQPGGLGCLQVDVYGDRLPLKACGTVSVRDPQLLAITVFDQDVSGREVGLGGWLP